MSSEILRPLLLVPTARELRTLEPFIEPLNRQFFLCGFGPIVAAARAAQLIAEKRPDRVLLAGIAGAYEESLSIGKAYAFGQVGCYGIGFGWGDQFRTAQDMGWAQWNPLGGHAISDLVELNVPSCVSEHACHGVLLTVTSAADQPADCRQRLKNFPTAVAEDMEAFGVAVACQLSGVPLTVVRGISNQAGDRNKDNWRVEAALQSVASLVSQTLAE